MYIDLINAGEADLTAVIFFLDEPPILMTSWMPPRQQTGLFFTRCPKNHTHTIIIDFPLFFHQVALVHIGNHISCEIKKTHLCCGISFDEMMWPHYHCSFWIWFGWFLLLLFPCFVHPVCLCVCLFFIFWLPHSTIVSSARPVGKYPSRSLLHIACDPSVSFSVVLPQTHSAVAQVLN